MATSTSLAVFAPVFVSLIFIVLVILRTRSSAVTMFDCAIAMLTIGIYGLTQLLTLYWRQSGLKQNLASTTISAFFDVDPTNKVKTLFRNSVADIKAADYSAQKDRIDGENRAVMLSSGAFVFAVMACGFGVLCLVYHMIFERRKRLDISSTCEICVFWIQLVGSFAFAVVLNLMLVSKTMCLHNKDAVNSCLNGIKHGLSYNLIQIWNSHQDLRDNLRQVPDVSKTIDALTASIASVINDIQILGSSLSGITGDVKSSLQTLLNELSSSLGSLTGDLAIIRRTPCISGDANASTNLRHLKSFAVVASQIGSTQTGKADVDVLVQNLWKSCQPLLTGLKDLSMINLCDSYQTTRDILVKLEQYCKEDEPDPSMGNRMSDNLNVLVTSFVGMAVLAFGGGRLLSGNLNTIFYFTLTTAVALSVYQIFIVDCGRAFSSTVDDWRLMLYSALSSL